MSPEPEPATLALGLVSHTNVGKTTLARTLLRRDVGEVLDQAHVTEENRRYTLLETDEGVRLELWDTPGFGDSVRLARLLRDQEEPLEWLARQAWDPVADRPLWCGQQAVLAVREEVDLVLYLVNSVEHPEEAGYVGPEMELLTRIGKPVLVLLNQTGPPQAPGERRAEEERWRSGLAEWPIVGGVLGLDAFTRCWIEEGVLLERARELLPEERRGACDALLAAWRRRQLAAFREALELLSGELARAAADREPIVEGAWGTDRKQAMRALARRMEQGVERALERLIALYGLEGRSGIELRTALADFESPAGRLSARKAGVWGGVVSGLATGVVADVLSGGLSLGSGMIVGALSGGFGAAWLTRAYTRVRGGREPVVCWSNELLDRTAGELLLRYLAVAHFGRGRGAYREREHPAFWRQAVQDAVVARRTYLHGAWKQARESTDAGATGAIREQLVPLLSGAAREVLSKFYPAAERLL